MKITCLLLITLIMLPAQTPPAQLPVNAAISGVVRDKSTGKPLPNYTVSTDVNATWVGNTIVQTPATKSIKSTTDETGRYRLADLPPAAYRIDARNGAMFGSTVTKNIRVAGKDLDDINFDVAVEGTISGKVVDENKEPIQGVIVMQVTREYYLGSIGYFFSGGASAGTNDRGEYTLPRVKTGTEVLLMADTREMRIPAHSDAPLNPKLRRRVPMRTFYLNSPSKDGAIPITLRPGENRNGVDIQMHTSQSYCAEGVLTTPNGPAALNFHIEAQQPGSGTYNGGGFFMSTPGAVTGSDGEFRICNLYPGSYRITATDRFGKPGENPLFGVAIINISDQDLKDLKIPALPGLPLEGEVVLDGTAPETPITRKVSVSLSPLHRSNFNGENNSARADIPGTFSFPGVAMDDYTVRAFINAPGLYVKDVVYGGRSVMYEPIRPGSGIGNGMRVTIGRDGATLSASVTGKDSTPLPDMQIVIMPADISSEAMLSSTIVTGQTDQQGHFTSQTLRPGKYYVAATDETFDHSPQDAGRLWRSHMRFTEVELPPSGTAQVTLQPAKIDR